MPDRDRRETVVVRLRPHVRALVWPSLLLVAVAGATGYFGAFFPEQWQNLAVLVGAGVLVLAGFLLPLARWSSRHYTITTRRIVVRTGLFVRHRQERLHSSGNDVTVRRTPLQLLFGTGDVLVGAGHDRPLVIADVSSPQLVQETLHDLREVNASVPDLS